MIKLHRLRKIGEIKTYFDIFKLQDQFILESKKSCVGKKLIKKLFNSSVFIFFFFLFTTNVKQIKKIISFLPYYTKH